MSRIRSSLLGAPLAAALLAAPAAAQVPLTPRALGMGGAYLGVARGQEAVFLNPANLGLADGPRWSVGFPQLSAGATVVGPELTDVRAYFDYDDLEPEERNRLLAEIPPGGALLEGELRLPLLAIQNRNFGVGVAYGMVGSHGVARDVVDLFLRGYDPNRRDYTVQGTNGRRATYWDVAAAYGQSVGPVSLGVTGHYYVGRSLAQTRAFDPSYSGILVTRNIEVEYAGVASEGGTGFGLDVGAALQPAPGLTLSAAVANAVSTFNWDEELVGRSIRLSREDFGGSDPNALRSEYDQSRTSIGTTPTGRFAVVADSLFEDTRVPTTLRIGAAWSVPGGTTDLSAGFHTNLREGRLGSRWDQLAGLGVQQRLGILRARLGASSDLEGGSLVGGGLSLGPLNLGLARWADGESPRGGDANGWVFTFGLSAEGRVL
ncbi:MAG: conjugal transfer protein TraF, partial [Gemmatimonadota bacterium]|nr:conjugal transfer protein TraF [Gemmatimonadota bacterium]